MSASGDSKDDRSQYGVIPHLWILRRLRAPHITGIFSSSSSTANAAKRTMTMRWMCSLSALHRNAACQAILYHTIAHEMPHPTYPHPAQKQQHPKHQSC